MLLPYGVDSDGHVVVAYRDEVVDLTMVEGLDVGPDIFSAGSLNPFMSLGPEAWSTTRRQLMECLDGLPSRARRPASNVRLVRPWEVGDYTDFYASRQHVEAMGRMLRPSEDPLPPAWLHLPIAYHGRAGTVIASGEPVYRPSGVLPTSTGPVYGPTERLDAEVELGFVVGAPIGRGFRIDAADAERHIFGMVLVNDWSARDIQAFEYRPLGPFLGKSFATSVSPWVVPMAALEPYRVAGPVQDPEPPSYLKTAEPRNLDVRLTLAIDGATVSKVSSAGLYWSPSQMLSHLTANGAGVRVGDLFATGTISGPGPGSLMEAWRGQKWIGDGQVVTIEGRCGEETVGSVSAEVVAA